MNAVIQRLFRSKPRVALNFNIAEEKTVLSLYKKSDIEYPDPRHNLGWSTKQVHLDLLYNLILEIKPKIIIETGTFEAHGTFAMAAAAHKNNNGATIYSVDYDGDPIQDAEGNVTDKEWLELRKYRDKNLTLIQEKFSNCNVNWIDGDSRKVLPEVLKKTGEWDFWYQDSMHYAEGIRQEWDLMETSASKSAIVIFDDVSKRNGFSRWFQKEKLKEWYFSSRRDHEHKQCWAQKRVR